MPFVQIGEVKKFSKKHLTKVLHKFSTGEKFFESNFALIFKVFNSIHRVFHRLTESKFEVILLPL